jgi:sRNA-binding protein
MSSRAAKRHAASTCLAMLCDRWPQCFRLADRRPIAVGTFEHILAELGDSAPPRHVLGMALRSYTGRADYLSGASGRGESSKKTLSIPRRPTAARRRRDERQPQAARRVE